MTRPRLAAAAVGASVAVVLAVPAQALAHPRLVGATPAVDSVSPGAPRRVRLRFDEAVQPVAAGIDVRDPSGRQVAVGPLRRRGATLSRAIRADRRGSYVVEWLVVGDDSHPARGAFIFSVGETTRSGVGTDVALGDALQASGRWLSLAGFVLGFGLPFASAVAGRELTRRMWRLVGLGVVSMIVAEVVSLLGQTATLQPSDPFRPQLAGDVVLTSYGRVAGLRLGGALALWALAGAVRQSRSQRALWTIPVLGAALAVVHADAAHRIEGIPTALSFLIVAVHIAAAVAWVGVIVFAILSPDRRLALLAAGATGLLLLSGVGLAVGHLTAVRDLAVTAYGTALAVKLGVVAVALGLGALGRRRAELAVASAALAAAATLVSLLPPS